VTLSVCLSRVVLVFCAFGALRAESPEERWLKLQSEGARLRGQGKYEDARRAFEEALHVTESPGGLGNRVAQTLNNLAAACYDGGHYAEAESYYQRALEIWKPDQSTESTRFIASLWSTLAALYVTTARDSEAELLFRKAIGLLDQKDEETTTLRVRLSNVLAQMYLKQGRPSDAEPLLLPALDGWETKPDDTGLALLLDTLGTLYRTERRYKEAERCYLRALRIHERLLGPEHHIRISPPTSTTSATY